MQIENQVVTLNSAEFVGNLIKTNFTVENQSAEELNVSSLINFSGQGEDGTNLGQDIFDCGLGIDGSVFPGDLLRENLCYEVPLESNKVKIYYEPDLFGQGVYWEVSR